MQIVRLSPTFKDYAWGVKGSESRVAKCLKGNGHEVDEEKPYAELWIGAHHSGPSLITESGKTIGDFLKENPEFFGAGNEVDKLLPFLLKVLSIGKPLSIQSHPDRANALKLHQSNSELYPDSNHKPEVAIALSPFEALCAFRPWRQIIPFLELPEVRKVLGEDYYSSRHLSLKKNANRQLVESSLKEAFSKLFHLDSASCKEPLDALLERAKGDMNECSVSMRQQLSVFLKLHDAFPGDPGCFAAFILNHVQLEAGDAIFISPNVLHSYISGEVVECMVNCDFTLRCGLTSKPLDIGAILETVEFLPSEPKLIRRKVRKPNEAAAPSSSQVAHYKPPVREFQLTSVSIGLNDEDTDPVDGVVLGEEGAALAVVVEGSIEVKVCNDENADWALHEVGSCLAVRKGTAMSIRPKEKGSRGVLFAATVAF